MAGRFINGCRGVGDSRLAGVPAKLRTALIQTILLVICAPWLHAQSSFQTTPTGSQPIGVAVVSGTAAGSSSYAVTANSGDNSVSIIQLNSTAQTLTFGPTTTVTGIPSPFGVASCGAGEALVTSPSDNAVRLIAIPSGQVIARVATGPEPYAAICAITPGGLVAAVSNVGDDSLVIFQVSSLSIVATVEGVPGSTTPHGMLAISNQLGNTWLGVAASDANTITILDLVKDEVLGQVPLQDPTAVFPVAGGLGLTNFGVAVAGSNSLIDLSADSAEISNTISNVPNPIDAVQFTGNFSGTAEAAVLGGTNSLWIDVSNVVSLVPGIPGATAMALMTLQPGNEPYPGVVLLVTSTDSNSLFAVYLQSAFPSGFSVQSAAGAAAVAPGGLAAAYATTGATQDFSAASVPLPTTLGGVGLMVGGSLAFDVSTGQWNYSSAGAVAAPLLFVGPNQVNFQVPPGIATGSAIPVEILEADGSTSLSTINLGSDAPEIFALLQNGQGQGAVQNQDYSQNLGTNPASPGSVIIIYATGAGATNPALQAGQAAPASPLAYTQAQPTVNIGGQTAQVQFSGLTPTMVGLWQINAMVPENITPGNAIPLFITANGATSNTVTIAVQ